MKKALATILVVVVLVASFAVGALGAIDVQMKPKIEPQSSGCYYACVDYGTFMSMYYCCPSQGSVYCELQYSAVGHC